MVIGVFNCLSITGLPFSSFTTTSIGSNNPECNVVAFLTPLVLITIAACPVKAIGNISFDFNFKADIIAFIVTDFPVPASPSIWNTCSDEYLNHFTASSTICC